MAARGISLLDLLPLPGGAQAVLPAEVAGPLENLAIVEHRSSTQPWAYVHHGRVTSFADVAELPGMASWPVKVPGLNVGVPFVLTLWRPAAGVPASPADTALEGEPVGFVLDLLLDDVRIEVPGLQAARVVGDVLGTGRPARLQRVEANSGRVELVGGAILRVASDTVLPPLAAGANPEAGGGDVSVSFVDRPDTFDPLAPTGAVVGLRFEPASFFFGSSDWGMTVGRVTYDASSTYTPPAIAARGQAPSWQGIAINEATVFFPDDTPLVGDLSVGVRDLLIGSPAGLQGELRVDFGHTSLPDTSTLVAFEQQDGAGWTPLTVTADRVSDVALLGTDDEVVVRARLVPPSGAGDVHATWHLPGDQTVADEVAVGPFTARVGQRVQLAVRIGDEVEGQHPVPMDFRFTRDASAATATFEIAATLGVDHGRVASVSGSADALDALELRTEPSDDQTRWTVGTGPGARQHVGATLRPALTEQGVAQVTAERGGTTRRVELTVLPEGDAVVGRADGPAAADGTDVPVTAVLDTFDLHTFNTEGRRSPATADVALAAGEVTVPDGVVANVAVARGNREDPDGPPDRARQVYHRQLHFELGEDDLRGDPEVVREPAELRAWAATLAADTEFLVIGRTCDLGTDAINDPLARDRAAVAAAMVRAATGGTVTIVERSEREGVGASADLRTRLLATDYVDETPEELGSTDTPLVERENLPPATTAAERESATRRSYRRADVYALFVDPAAPELPREPASDDAQRRALVPGTATPVPPSPPETSDRPEFRVRLVVRWDSPVVASPGDAIPTLAELAIEWEGDQVALPPPTSSGGSSGGDGTATGGPGSAELEPLGSTTPSPSGAEIWTLLGRWTHDARSGETSFTLALDKTGSPDGIAAVASDALAMALALGPALLGNAELDDPEDAGLALGGLLAAVVVAEAFGKDGRVVLTGLEIQHLQQGLTEEGFAAGRDRILVDYVVEIGVDLDLAGVLSIRTEDGKPLKMTFTNVGIEWDRSREGWEQFQFVYEDASIGLADPGSWRIDSTLGEILRVVNPRTGTGSTWIEVDLEFALDLGVITLTRATVRATFSDGGFDLELRGLAVEVDLPGVLSGSGRVALSGGGFRAGVDVEIVPINAKALAAFAYDAEQDFFFLEIGVLFPAGIPLGGSGLGLFGGMGRFVVNGTRNLAGLPEDIVGREVGWYGRAPEEKYVPFAGQNAIGLGLILGTLPDTAFTFNLSAMLTVAFPDIAVNLGVHAFFLAEPKIPGEQREEPESSSLSILGIVNIDATAVAVAIVGSYAIPKVLELSVPIAAFFPTPAHPDDPGFYIRIGADGAEGRTGDPVRITFLPDVLDITAWAFLMIEERGIVRLGGESMIPDLLGFAIGFGAGADFEWSAGPFTLSLGFKILLGVGTKPMTMVGYMKVWGELDLVIVSVGVSGEMLAVLREDDSYLTGKFCGKVSFFFFTVKGCVEISIGDASDSDIPEPDPPAVALHLVDRLGTTSATGAPTAAAADADREEHTAWPDAVPVVEFAHHVSQDWLAGSMFRPSPPPAGNHWSGSSGLRYAFRVRSVELLPEPTDEDDPLPAVWWTPTHRPGIIGDTDVPVGEGEGRHLALMSRDPFAWARALTQEGLDLSVASPDETIRRTCTDVPVAVRGCVDGHVLQRTDVDRVQGAGESASTAFESSLRVRGVESFPPMTLAAGVAQADLATYLPGAVHTVPAAVHPDGAWRIGRLLLPGSQLGLTSSLRLDCSPRVVDAEVTLYACLRPQGGRFAGDATHARTSGVPSVPFAPAAGEVCVEARELTADAPLPQTIDGFTVDLAGGGDAQVFTTGAGDTVLLFPAGVTVELPFPAPRATVRVGGLAGAAVTVAALDGRGALVDEQVVPGDHNVHEVVLTGEGITTVVLKGGGGEGVLVSVCLPGSDDEPTLGDLADGARTDLPVVVGHRPDGGRDVLDPTVSSVPGEPGCAVVTYTAPRATTEYAALEVLPWLGGPVSLVRVCGVSTHVARLVEDNRDHRDGLGSDLDDTAAETEPGALVGVLRPDTRYEVRVQWEWQGWRVPEDSEGAVPPPVDDGTWIPGPATSFFFRTAAEIAPALLQPRDADDDPTTPMTVEPVDTVVRQVFDPRAVAIYLRDTRPSHPDEPPLFLDDPIEVRARAGHVEELLSRYDRELRMQVVRTELPAGGLHDDDVLIDLLVVLLWRHFHELDDAGRAAVGEESDVMVHDATVAAPCRTPGPRGPGLWEVAPEGLVPDTAYDIVITAPRTTGPAEPAPPLVLRTSFRTSRWDSERGLLDALGLADGDLNLVLPHDAIVTGAIGAAPAGLAGDEAFDAVLAAVGLDPWPVPPASRTAVLWEPGPSGFLLRGVLLESMEPILRPGRLEVARVAVVHHPVGGGPAVETPLGLARANGSGARVLFTPGAPLVLDPSADHTLEVDLRGTLADGPRTTGGRRRLLHMPKLAYQEAR